MTEKSKCVQLLLPALVDTEEQKQMTDLCVQSLNSQVYPDCIKLTQDNNKYETRVAGAWNALLNPWRGQDYDYLMIVASDTQADPLAIDYMVRCMEDNPKAGIVSGHVTRDLDDFKKNYGQYKYSGRLTQGYHSKDPACFLLRKGVIEKVGLIDEEFPMEFVERDFIRRIWLAGEVYHELETCEWIEPEEILWYHPPFAGTNGNDDARLQKALRKYLLKWAGDAGEEKFTHPYNDLRLDYTFTGSYI